MVSKLRSLLGITCLTLAIGLYFIDNVVIAAGNFGVGGYTFGDSAEGTLGITNGTEPTTAPADVVQLYSKDVAAGDNRLHIRSESGDKLILGNNKIETSTNDLSLQPTSGNVGIGITSPGAKLDVIGNVRVGTIAEFGTASGSTKVLVSDSGVIKYKTVSNLALQGQTGATGPKGDKGDQGIQGQAGADGTNGADGAQGLKGDKGDKGDTGPQGPPGVASAAICTWSNTTYSTGARCTTGPDGNQYFFYTCQSNGSWSLTNREFNRGGVNSCGR